MLHFPKDYQKLPVRALTCMRINQAILTSVIVLVFIAIYSFMRWLANLPARIYVTGSWIMAVLLMIQLVLLLIGPPIRFSRYRYCFDTDKLEVVEGLFIIERHILPVTRIHQINVQQGPIDRLFNLAGITITTAGGSVSMNLLDETVCQDLAAELTTRINAAVDAAKKEAARKEESCHA